MSITQLYSGYFQKSKAFLFPLLGIPRSDHTASIQTFIHWKGTYTLSDHRLIVVKLGGLEFPEYKKFEKVYLEASIYFEGLTFIDLNTRAYVFNLESNKDDWQMFLEGRYSRLSSPLKKLIRNYYIHHPDDWDYIKTFLYPHQYLELYTELLWASKDYEKGLALLESVGELCDPYDPEEELYQVVNKAIEPTTKVF